MQKLSCGHSFDFEQIFNALHHILLLSKQRASLVTLIALDWLACVAWRFYWGEMRAKRAAKSRQAWGGKMRKTACMDGLLFWEVRTLAYGPF